MTSDVMRPVLRLTNQHKGVISSITQLPEPSNDVFLTGCSDGNIRMYSFLALNMETESPLRTFS